MAQHDQQTKDLHRSARSSTTPIVLASLAVVAAAYFGFVRPAQEHMLSLERQCNKLVLAVKKLQSKDDTALHGLRVLNLLDAQGEKLAGAERTVARFSSLCERMMHEADLLAEATTSLQKFDAVRQDVERFSQTLTSAAATLGDMAEVSDAITASGDIATKANASLTALGEQQTVLEGNFVKLGQQLSELETQIDVRGRSLPQARQTLTQIDQLCELLSNESESISTAHQQLDQLAGLKQEVLDHATNTLAAAAALDQIWDLKDGLLQATGTLKKAQKLAIDMMLLEPVIDKVAKSLQPASEATRLSRRAAAKATEARQAVAPASSSSPWSSAINVFVALLGSAN